MSKQQIGVIGMAVMGSNLALNIQDKGYKVSIFNRSSEKTNKVIAEHAESGLHPTFTIEEFVNSLEKPRKIILMVKAGDATDKTIQSVLPFLEKGDILIDGGNTYFQDTIRRSNELEAAGIHFMGVGISGGEEGARKGPSIMPGGPKDAYHLVEPILKEIAAKAEDGKPCVTYIGENGAGHYVKMVHNGIEYGDMQLISESYDILSRGLGMSAEEISTIFSEWNEGVLDSFLMEITTDILKNEDPVTGKPMVEMIVDKAGNKGTGKWTSQSALDLGEPLSLITESVFARYLSSLKEQRVEASENINVILANIEIEDGEKSILIKDLHDALYFAKIMSYAQGFSQLKAASEEYQWNLPFSEIASIWRAGCIIRARFLQNITNAYQVKPDLMNLMFDDYFKDIVEKYHYALRKIVIKSIEMGISVPTFASALSYFDGYRTATLPANMIQAQRDYFGAHTYQRVDKDGTFHFLWNKGQETQILD